MIYFAIVVLFSSILLQERPVYGLDLDEKQAFMELSSRLQALEDEVKELRSTVSDQGATIQEQQYAIHAQNNIINNMQKQAVHTTRPVPSERLTGDMLRKQRFILPESAVAFFARVDLDEVTNLVVNNGIRFEHVEVNAGGGYSNATGEFVAPNDGYYMFSVAIASDLGHVHEVQAVLMRNDVIVARTHAHGDSGHIDQGGITAITILNAGDRVSVKVVDGTAVYGKGMTTFAGLQLMFK